MDARLTPSNGIVACSTLRGKIKHSNFVEGKNYEINVPFVDLLATPDGKRNRQLIYGSKVKYFVDTDGWAFVQNTYDNYVGYVPQNTIVPETKKTHIVSAPLTHVFLEPNIKSRNIEILPLAARVSGKLVENSFLETELGWISAAQLKRKTELPKDPVEVSKLLQNAPYLWGGNTSLGIDCSGLIQISMLLCGLACPGDSDQQMHALGQNLDIGSPRKKGDILFWKGHVAWVLNERQILHANAYHMATVIEETNEAIERIKKQDKNNVIAHKRLTGELNE
ncbi:C40 family peptidase [Rhodobacteraceae bacterium]|nr:C40 family peptidase [Paracoccaceae bacterium]